MLLQTQPVFPLLPLITAFPCHGRLRSAESAIGTLAHRLLFAHALLASRRRKGLLLVVRARRTAAQKHLCRAARCPARSWSLLTTD